MIASNPKLIFNVHDCHLFNAPVKNKRIILRICHRFGKKLSRNERWLCVEDDSAEFRNCWITSGTFY